MHSKELVLGIAVVLSAFTLVISGLNMVRGPYGDGAEVMKKIDSLTARFDALMAAVNQEKSQKPVAPVPAEPFTQPKVAAAAGVPAGIFMRPAVLLDIEAKAEQAYWYQARERELARLVWEKFSSPNWPCMWGEALIGEGVGDGSKWMCGAHVMQKPCVVYSFGSKGNFKFEEGIKALGLNCDIHIFDPTFGDVGVTRGPGWTYHHVGLRASDNRSDPTAPYLTLQTIMRENHHTFLDVLKIDIEGGELGVVRQLARDGWPSVGQLLVEAHQTRTFRTEALLAEWMNSIESANLRLFHAELNIHKACCMEYAFIHKDWRPEIKDYLMTSSK
ncbi:mettl24 [Symbiodinium pilosum]|uniref:Mettl24 protein n=1 Tax=Symbiodinium pilosum TaxID=2952 RepID=A0A812X5S3_SYMPI|nr:mettl24 [Symbiodinium pilosum]